MYTRKVEIRTKKMFCGQKNRQMIHTGRVANLRWQPALFILAEQFHRLIHTHRISDSQKCVLLDKETLPVLYKYSCVQ